MTTIKRWTCLALSLAVSLSLSLPALATEPVADSFASFLIDASTTDFPEKSLQVELYRRDDGGAFRLDDAVRYSCQINRVAGEASFFIQPKADGVWVEVDYLTDLDGDGVYEMLDGEDALVCDSMTATGALTTWDGTNHTLTNGQTYLLSVDALKARAQAALTARTTAGSGQTLPIANAATSVDQVLYFITLRYLSPADHQEYALSYYLQLFDTVIMPSDVPAGAWYYDAVEFALDQGLFSGTGADAFSPTSSMTRAMLWAVLAKLDGQSLAGGDPWYSSAQSWAISAGISDGADPNGSITREQLALMLYNLNQPDTAADVSRLASYTDGEQVSSWAAQAMAWALEQGILSGKGDGVLDPQGSATRAEVAAVLRQYTLL